MVIMIHKIHFHEDDNKLEMTSMMVTMTFPFQFINFYASLIYIAFFKVKKKHQTRLTS